jgi:hypothetical protein
MWGKEASGIIDFWLVDSRLLPEMDHKVLFGNSNPDQSYGISNIWGEMWGKASKIDKFGGKHREKLIFTW